MPFGMAKPAPSTNGHVGNKWGWEATGYDYRDQSIEGFPCLHEFQIGGIVLMPTEGRLKTIPGAVNDTTGVGYRSRFNHEQEVVTPGYYAVDLLDYDIRAELTATPRVALQRYTFPASAESHILFDIGNRQGESGAAVDAEVRLTEEGLVEGWVITEPEYVKKYEPGSQVPLYFSASLDKQPTGYGIFHGERAEAGKAEATGVGAGLYLTFTTTDQEQITAKVGLSYTSVANARLNRETEAASCTFEEAKAQAVQTWETYLGRIRVETANRADKVKFYTGLYHALLGRGLASDVNGAYPRHNGGVGQLPMKGDKPAFSFYNSDAAWGAQWNLSQLWALAQWAKQRGDEAKYAQLMELSKGWELLYDPTSNFICPKQADGTFIPNFNPMEVWRGFQEGNAWQYTFYVPHDPQGLIDKVGVDVFNARLDSIFTVSRELIFSGGQQVDAFAGLQTLYNHGNQPCLHISWLFNEAGRPSLTQKWVRAILNEFYGTDGIHGYGYGQDEDQGQLGAWYVMGALGLFDIKGLTASEPTMGIARPLFDKVTIQLSDRYYKGKQFVIETQGNVPDNDYIEAIRLDGKQWTDTHIPFTRIVNGGHLELELGIAPTDDYAK